METDDKCPECQGHTVQFRGSGRDTQYKICTRYREKGHKTDAEIDAAIAAVREANYPASGRFG